MALSNKSFQTYVPVDQVDWSKAIGGLYGAITEIGAEREKEKKELEDLMTNSIKDINNQEMLKSQSLNDYIAVGAESGRNTIVQANKQLKAGQITPQQYRSIVNNVNTSWSSMANSMKNFDATNQELLKRQQIDPKTNKPLASEYEVYLSQQHAYLGDLKNQSYMFDPNTGNGYIIKYNPDSTIQKSTNSMMIANPSNITDDYFDFDAEFVEFTKSLGGYTDERGNFIVSNPLDNINTKQALTQKVMALTSNDRMIAQVLARYNGANFYSDETELQSNIEANINQEAESRKLFSENPQVIARIAELTKSKNLTKEQKAELNRLKAETAPLTDDEKQKIAEEVRGKMIFSGTGEGNTYQPIITDEQRELARKIIQNQIMGRIPYKRVEENTEIQNRPQEVKVTVASQGGGGSSAPRANQADQATTRIFNEFKSAFNNVSSLTNLIKQNTGRGDLRVVVKNGQKMLQRETTTEQIGPDFRKVKVKAWTDVNPITNMQGLRPYLKGIDQSQWTLLGN